jgi:hypothetical protein
MDSRDRDENRDENKEREVEQWLDAALGQYGTIEPRAGLESRVLANLQAERSRRAEQRRWWWTVGTVAVAAAIVAAVWVGESGSRKVPPITAKTPTTHREETGTPREPAPRLPVADQAREVPRHPRADQTIRQVAALKPPKLEQFPTPSPLSAQEEMLARYVQEFPQRATLMARAQTELRKQDEREMAAPWPTNDASGLQKQE